MSNQNISIEKAEQRNLLAKEVRALFIQMMRALGHSSVKHGGDLLPRSVWSSALAMAMAERGVITPAQCDAVAVVLNSDLGNSSQLGGALKKEGILKVEDAATAATSLTDLLAKLAAEKLALNPPAAPSA